MDALDECRYGLEQLLKFIIKSLSSSSQVKWIVSSRHKPDIEKWVLPLKECTADLNLERDAKDKISHAIKAYIYIKINALFTIYESAYGIQDLDIQNPDILVELQKVEDDVAKELHTRAGNTFLWVSLPFEQIEASKCDANNVS